MMAAKCEIAFWWWSKKKGFFEIPYFRFSCGFIFSRPVLSTVTANGSRTSA